MKYYIAYKFSGADSKILRETLVDTSEIVELAGHTTFISHRDLQNWGDTTDMSTKKIIDNSLAELDKSDGILCLVFSSDKSEGMLIEAGYARALNKKIVVAKQKEAKIVFLRDIANEVMEFDDYEDFKNKLREYFK